MAETPSKLPSFVNWPSFPFEGQLRVKNLEPAVSVEPPREGEEPDDCVACTAPEEAYIWVSDRWRVRAMDQPSGLPMVLILESRSHLDLGDLPNLLAAELGVMTVRLERAIRSLDGVARVHVNRWGDGAAHLHLWFMARPVGQLQLRGSFLSLWDDILEPIPDLRWRENLAHVAAWLAEFGGRALAEPPRIDWLAPSRFGEAARAGHVDIDDAPAEVGDPVQPVDVLPDPAMALDATHPTVALDTEHATVVLEPVDAANATIVLDTAESGDAASDDDGGDDDDEPESYVGVASVPEGAMAESPDEPSVSDDGAVDGEPDRDPELVGSSANGQLYSGASHGKSDADGADPTS